MLEIDKQLSCLLNMLPIIYKKVKIMKLINLCVVKYLQINLCINK
jgi:hypothetical protein